MKKGNVKIKFFPDFGTILRCNFGEPKKPHKPPEMVKMRPVVVVSSKRNNHYTTVVIPISSVPSIKKSQLTCFLTLEDYPFLTKNSWIKCEMIQVVANSRLDRIKYNGAYRQFMLKEEHYLQVKKTLIKMFALNLD